MKKIILSLVLAGLCLQGLAAPACAHTGAEKYDHAENFAGHGYSVVHRDGKKGVVSADGSEIIPPEWDSVVIDDAGSRALCMNYPEGPVAVIDLDTGEAYHREESLPTAYVADRYALQGDVRVYTRNNRVGIEDADGKALCDAKYDCIEAFRGLDCAITHLDGKLGVLRRDGREVVEAEWDYIMLSSDGRAALCQRYNATDAPTCIFDTKTGRELCRSDEDVYVEMKYDCIIVQNYRPPYRTDVYDTGMTRLFSVNARLDRYESYYLAEFNDGSRGMIDLEGNTVIDGLSDIGYLRDGYAAYFRSEYAYASEAEQAIDQIGNGLDRLLWKNNGKYRDRNCVEWVMYRMGVETQPRQETKKYLGVIGVTGERFEYDGPYVKGSWGDLPSDAIKVGGEGLYIVNVAADEENPESGWTYLDAAGQQAVPGRYDSAYMFVEGSAVVYKDGLYYLIDKNGEKLCDIGDLSCMDHGMVRDKEQPLIARCYGGNYHRLIDRRGEFVNDVRYRTLNYGLDGYFIAGKMGGGAVLIDAQGNAFADGGWEIYAEGSFDGVPGAWMWKNDLLYHIDLETGQKTHEQGYAEVNARAARLPGGDNWVVFDEMGNPVGPYYEQEDQF